jgi:hypothetical protein
MRENGLRIKPMEKVSTIMQTGLCIVGNGAMTCKKERERKHGKMVPYLKVLIRKE